jgi:hypothetical protein
MFEPLGSPIKRKKASAKDGAGGLVMKRDYERLYES